MYNYKTIYIENNVKRIKHVSDCTNASGNIFFSHIFLLTL